jgi:hypothetical protein
MKEKLSTIFGVIIFVTILGGMIYLIVYTEDSNMKMYTDIELVGNQTISAEDYLISSDLNKSAEYPEFTLQEIKSRILKHPYVAEAEVQADGTGKVNIKVVEKSFMAVVLIKAEVLLITENFELINLKMNSDISGLPVISNVTVTKINNRKEQVQSAELIRAFKIIDAIKMVSDEMCKALAEINVRHGGDVILSFSGISCPVIFGKGSVGKKIVALSTIWDGLEKQDKLFKNSSYVDLRFNSEIFIGEHLNTETNG